MRSFTHLTLEQRYQIQALMKMGHSYQEIGGVIGVHKSTITREVRRNQGRGGYRPQQAHRFTLSRRRTKVRRRIAAATWHCVNVLLKAEWSPVQISGWLRTQQGTLISPEWIYQHVYRDKRARGTLYRHLRCQRHSRKRYGTYSRRGHIPNRLSIERRPAVVERRSRLGDWEVDTMIGKGHQQALVSLTERKSRLSLIAKVARRGANTVATAVINLLKPLGLPLHTVTSDNGKEFAHHAIMVQALKVRFFFAHPYAAWERGLNENTNGLIRQYFPKQRPFTTITQQEIQQVMNKLNNRPRKSLGFKTPNQVCFGIHPIVALTS
ncbi:MAG TPA: IS30 family transposase [Nitrospirales bacterium]|nr:IS30 family transposase [Nitrospirales bacterium]